MLVNYTKEKEAVHHRKPPCPIIIDRIKYIYPITKCNMKQKKRLFAAITFLIIVLVLWCFRPQVQSKMEIKQEEKRLDWILAEINDLYIANDDIQKQWNELETQQTQLHNAAEENREKIDELWIEYDNSKLFIMAWQEK